MLRLPSTRTLVIPPLDDQPRFPISAADLAVLLQNRKPVTYQPNQPIFGYGKPERILYVIVSGTVEIRHDLPNNTSIVLTELGEREIFGEVAALYDGVRSAAAVAKTLTDVLPLEFDDLDVLLTQHTNVAMVIMRSMAHRLSRSSQQMRKANYHLQRSDATRDYTWIDSIVLGIAGFLGGGVFLSLFGVVLALWVWMYYRARFDPNLLGLALTLSVVQIIFAVAVLNSQNRAAAHEQKLTDAEHYAILETYHTLEGLRKQLDAQPAGLQAVPTLPEQQRNHR